jgi:predicted nucleic acid-binding protein
MAAVFYLDTSAVLKRYRTEKGTIVIDSLYQVVPRPVLVTSFFTCLEVESVAARMKRGKLLSDEAYGALLNSFGRDMQNDVQLLPVGTDIMMRAMHAAERYALRPGDCLHLMSAHKADVDYAGTTVLVSSDKELLEAAKAQLEVLDPEAENALDALLKYYDLN